MVDQSFKDLIVIELANVLAGPSVGMFFAELGATVIKIENVNKGDVTRSWKLATEDEGTDISSYFTSVNWGKEAIAVNFKTNEGQRLVFELLKKAEVVITSFKPGDAQKFGMDYNTVAEVNDQIIYGEIIGFGGADHRPGYDAIIQAEAGFTYINGEAGGQPVKMPVALMDVLAAHQLKEGILIALLQKLKTGEGTKVTASLFQSGVSSLVNQATNWLVGGQVPQRQGSEHPNIVPYGTVFTCKEGKEIVLAIGNDAQFDSLCQILNLEELPHDKRFKSNYNRVQNRNDLIQVLNEAITGFSREELQLALQEANVPYGSIHNMAEVFENSQAKNMLLKSNLNLGVSSLAFHLGNNGFDLEALKGPPRHGEHTDEILKNKLAMPESEVADLKHQNIVY